MSKENTENNETIVRDDWTSGAHSIIVSKKNGEGEDVPVAFIIRHPECPIEDFRAFIKHMNK